MRIFIDTNVLVYFSDPSPELYQISLDRISDFFNSGDELFISPQVLREFIRTMTAFNIHPIEKILEYLNFFMKIFNIVYEDSNILFKLIYLLKNYQVKGRAIFDCNIVATMISNNIDSILTHNVKDFKKYDKLISIIPLI